MNALRPVRDKLQNALTAVFRDHKEDRANERNLATNILADYDADNSEVLAALLMDADDKQFTVLFAKVEKNPAPASFLETVEKPLDAEKTEADKEKWAKRQANAAVALLRLGQPDTVWPLLKQGPDPRVRSYLIHYLSPRGADAGAIARRLDEEKEVSIRRALLLILGEFGKEQMAALLPKVLQLYREDPDAGMHGAADWLLRQWGQADELKKMDRAWAEDKQLREEKLGLIRKRLGAEKGRGGGYWYVNGQGQTMVAVPGPVEFLIGSPTTETGRFDDEKQHKEQIDHSFAIAAKEVTVEQFLRFRPQFAYRKQDAPTPDCPINEVSWYDAAAYCNWLSGQEGLHEDQWFYVANASGDFAEGVKMSPDYPNRIGYRLPTDAEWEYACRAGAITSRSYGESEDLLSQYSWCITNSQGRFLSPVGRLMPNDFGLFDMLGNAAEWCQEPWPAALDSEIREDEVEVKDGRHRILRGGAFNYRLVDVRAAYRDADMPTNRYFYYGLRPARTIR